MLAKRNFMTTAPRLPDDGTGTEWRQRLTNSHAGTDIVAALAVPPFPHRLQRKELWLGERWHSTCQEHSKENRMTFRLELLE